MGKFRVISTSKTPTLSVKPAKYLEKHKIISKHISYYKIALVISVLLNCFLILKHF